MVKTTLTKHKPPFKIQIRKKKPTDHQTKPKKPHSKHSRLHARKVFQTQMQNEQDEHELEAQQKSHLQTLTEVQTNQKPTKASFSESHEQKNTNLSSGIQIEAIHENLTDISELRNIIEKYKSTEILSTIAKSAFFIALPEIYKKTVIPQSRIEILHIMNFFFDKYETKCQKFIQEKGIDFLIEIIGESSIEVIQTISEILGNLAAKKVAYRNLIMKKQGAIKLIKIFSKIESVELVNNFCLCLNKLSSGQSKLERIHLTPIVEYFCQQIKMKTLKKAILAKSLETMVERTECFYYLFDPLTEGDMCGDLFEIINEEMKLYELSMQKTMKAEKNEQDQEEEKERTTTIKSVLRLLSTFAHCEMIQEEDITIKKLMQHDIMRILETFVDHKSSDVRLGVVEIVSDIASSGEEVGILIYNDHIMKNIFGFFPNANQDYQKDVQLFFLSLCCIQKNKKVLQFFIKYEVVAMLINTLKDKKSPETINIIVSALESLVSYGRDFQRKEKKVNEITPFSKIKPQKDTNPIVDALMNVPGAQAIFDQLIENDDDEICGFAYDFLHEYPFDSEKI